MTRIGTYGASQLYISRVLEVQERMHKWHTQVTTEKKSTVYSGIAGDANRLINFENERATADMFIKNNTITKTKMEAASTSVEAMRKQILSLRTFIENTDYDDDGAVKQLQEFAFRTMVDLSAYLGITVDGQYLFSGGRVDTAPVDLPASTLTEFQALYDGVQNTYPTTRATHMQELDLDNTDFGTLVFDYNDGIIKSSNLDGFSNLATGSRFTVGGTNANDKTFTVQGRVVTNVAGDALTEAATIGATAFITHANGTATLDNATTGDLSMAFDAQGRMVVTPTTAGTLAGLAIGSTFTINNSTANGWDGAYKVVANNGTAVTIVNDTGNTAGETATGAIAFQADSDADGIPDAATPHGLPVATAIPITVSGNTASIALGVDLTADFGVGDPITISGTAGYNGTYTVTSINATTIEFELNAEAVRVSQLIPQTGRTDITMSWNDNDHRLTSAEYGTLGFSLSGAGGETITGAAGSFLDASGDAYPPVGTVIRLASTSGVNDGYYTVSSNDGTNIVVASTIIEPDAGLDESAASATMTSSSWYKGDDLNIEHRVDVGRTVELGVNALHPAFEKALRAAALIAQGAGGTAGNIAYQDDRRMAARWLLNDAVAHPAPGPAPYGIEDGGDLEGIASMLAIKLGAVKNTDTKHTEFKGFLDTRIVELENVDKTEAIARLLDDQNALEAGYQALSRVRDMTLLNYMK